MRVNLTAAVKHLGEIIELAPTGWCAKHVRLGLEAGGMDTTGHPVAAKDYGPFLVAHGFSVATPFDIDKPLLGDIVVLPALPNLEFGHIAMFDGLHWLSDFKQNDMWGGPAWRADKHFVVYRQM